MTALEYLLLAGLVITAVAAPLCRRMLATVIVYMAFSLLMAVLWSLLAEPRPGHHRGRRGRRHHQHPIFPDAEENPRAEGDPR